MIDLKFYGSLLLCVLILFGLGYYFGYKSGLANNEASFAALKSTLNNSTNNQLNTGSNADSSNLSLEVKNVDGVFFIKANNEPICPPENPVKGTFTTSNGFFYTPENKNYNRIKPDICFASLEFARDTAGFVQKF